MADPFQTRFEKESFFLGRLFIDYKVSPRLKKLKQDSTYKIRMAAEKTWKDQQAKLLDLVNPLLNSSLNFLLTLLNFRL